MLYATTYTGDLAYLRGHMPCPRRAAAVLVVGLVSGCLGHCGTSSWMCRANAGVPVQLRDGRYDSTLTNVPYLLPYGGRQLQPQPARGHTATPPHMWTNTTTSRTIAQITIRRSTPSTSHGH